MEPQSNLRRSPPAGGYSRGDETRERLIEAALEVFGEEGYARASTRQIAAVAGVTPPALQYYFDSKEGLHRACGERFVETLTSRFADLFDEAWGATTAGKAEAEEALCRLLEGVLDLSTQARPTVKVWRRFIAQAQGESPGPAYAVIREGWVKPLHRISIALTAAAMERPAGDETARLIGMMFLSQLSAFGMQRALTLEEMGWDDLEGPRGETVRRTVRQVVKAAVRQP